MSHNAVLVLYCIFLKIAVDGLEVFFSLSALREDPPIYTQVYILTLRLLSSI